MLRRCVVKYHVKHTSHIPPSGFPNQFLHILHGAEHGVHGQVVGHIIAIVVLGGFEKRGQPYIVNSQLLQVIQAADYPS